MIQSSLEDHAAGLIRYYAVYHGTVADTVDPEKLHRVRVNIPGLLEPSNWAWPLTAGGGSAQRGGHVVPAKGADVLVWFLGGDLERPVYAGGWWGKPDAGTEMPKDVDEVTPEEAAKLQSLEFEKFKITIDEREGKWAFAIIDKVSGDNVTFDLKNQALNIKMTAAILIEVLGVFDVSAAQLYLNGRQVLPDSKSI